MKTRSIKKEEQKEKWYVIDAKGKRVGKLAAKVAALLIGKNDVDNVSYLLTNNKVIIVNSGSVDIHPRKKFSKMYYKHSGFIGNLKAENYEELQGRRPNKTIELAVKGMLPKTKQQPYLMNHLFIYETEEHNHSAQQPVKIEL